MQELGWIVEGIDPDPVVVERARLKGLNAQQGTLVAQSYPDCTFDAVYLSHVLEHVHDPAAVLRECGRILKPGGRIVVLTPNVGALSGRLFGASWLGHDPPRHLMLFSVASLRSTAAAAGLSVKQLRSTARAAEIFWIASSMLRRFGHLVSLDEIPLPQIVQAISQGLVFQVIERVLMLAKPDLGEELLLIGSKGRTCPRGRSARPG
jgi:SAM-dependent methyltransferase